MTQCFQVRAWKPKSNRVLFKKLRYCKLCLCNGGLCANLSPAFAFVFVCLSLYLCNGVFATVDCVRANLYLAFQILRYYYLDIDIGIEILIIYNI